MLLKIYTLVAEIDDAMDLIIGMQSQTELEGIMNSRVSGFEFLLQSIPIFPDNDMKVPIGGIQMVKFHCPFPEVLSGRAICKFFAGPINHTLKLRIENNKGVVKFENNGLSETKFNTFTPIGILDLRSLGYFRVTYQRLLTMMERNHKVHHYAQYSEGPAPEVHCEATELAFNHVQLGQKQVSHDPYPWLAPDDVRRCQSDAQILYDQIDLSTSDLTHKDKSKMMKLILKYKKAFSLRDEIGECPNLKADVQVIDDSPFFVRPFPISEADKPYMDRQMERLVSLVILTKNSTSHTSPVMLITRKLTNDKHPVVDFRLLNTRILRQNTSIPLMSDVLSILGNSNCEVLTCVDIKDAYHSIRLTEKSKEYCGILPYFGSPIYRYEALPMGIACAPQIWMDYITLILSNLKHREKYIAIMDDMLIHSTRQDHWLLVEQLFQSMIRNGLKLSPKKCQFFRTKLTYMGNEFVIKKKTITITPLKS